MSAPIDRGRWARPPRPFRVDADRWRSYVRTLEQRIAAVRMLEGIDSSVRPWQTFSPPLPPLEDLDPPPAVLLRLAPIPRLARDPNGRLIARRDTPHDEGSRVLGSGFMGNVGTESQTPENPEPENLEPKEAS